jgi:hypothetical protein
MIGVGGDVRKIARLLQKKAPPGHMLAYINQEEADLLKARGGSGEPHADTGVPSFEVGDYTEFDTPMPVQQEAAPVPQGTEMDFAGPATQPSVDERYQQAFTNRMQKGSYMPYGSFTPAPQSGNVSSLDFTSGQAAAPAAVAPSVQAGDFLSAPSSSRYTDENISGSLRDSAARAAAAPPYIEPTQDKDLLGKVGDWWGTLSPDTKAKLGIGGVQAVLGAYSAQQSAEQGRKAKEELSAMAAPYQQQGKELVAKAQRGELSPAAQQQLQAVQAQAAQGAQARGGVGAQQAQAQVEAFRQQLLQGQYDYGLKVAGIGDQIMTGAIKTGIQADQYVNNLTNTYFNNIARTLSPQLAQTSGQQPGSTTPIA